MVPWYPDTSTSAVLYHEVLYLGTMVQLLYEYMTDLWEFVKCIWYAKPPLFPFPGLHHPLNRAPSSHVPGTLVGAFEFFTLCTRC